MPRVSFTQNLQRHVRREPLEVDGGTLRDALEAVFAVTPQMRGYVLEDQGSIRRHVVVFIDGGQSKDRDGLSDPLRPDSDVHVMQALSGG